MYFALTAAFFCANAQFVVENKTNSSFVVENKIHDNSEAELSPEDAELKASMEGLISDLKSLQAELTQKSGKTASPPETRAASKTAGSAPTPYGEVVRVLALLPTPKVGYVDLGCGDGRWLFAAAERWPGVCITGVEIDPARAAATRERVRDAGLGDRITIITGDATTTDVQADVGTAYLYQDVLDRLKPRIEKLTAFASYIHRPAGVPVVKNGDTWIYTRPVAQQAAIPTAVWNGQLYTGRMCNNQNCGMCASIQNQLAAAQQQSAPAVGQPPKSATGHWQRFKICNGRACWFEDRWVENKQ